MKYFTLVVASLLISVQYAQAETKFGLAMVGEPKYTAERTHLDYANPDAPKGGILKQSAVGGFDTLNPYSIKGKAALGLDLVTDRLMARVWDEPFTMYPLIAESIDIPEDRSSITFHINPKAQFHDGSKITADDVLFSYETLKEKGRPNQRRIYQLAKATKLDSKSIKFEFGEGYDRETALIFCLMPVLSKTYWQDKEFDKTTLNAPLGNGPYKITSAEPGKRIELTRVENYWAKDLLPNKGHHNFDKIIYDYYRDDTVAFESFKTGDLNLRREWDAGTWNNAYDFPALSNGRVIKEEIKHGRPDKVRGFIFNTRRAPFNDIKVRKALNLVFDFDWMNKNFFYNEYRQINSFYPNTDLARKTEKDPSNNMRENRREAENLLKESGWIIKDGKRINAKTGDVMSFEIILDTPSDEKIALSLTRTLKKMGIEANVRVLDSAAYRGRMNDYDFDMTLYFWHSTLSPGTEQYLYWSCESANMPSRWNYAGICDPEIDSLAQAIPTAKSRAELLEYTQKLDSKLWMGLYFIPLYYNPNDYVTYWKTLKRPENTPLYGIVLETWWAEPPNTP
ncbi:MAG: extracellular solute-binding protein [Alphaproteobacteria bacterium]|nr:extracellular solute-binding protein [Alphaproteobacteria bacterium]